MYSSSPILDRECRKTSWRSGPLHVAAQKLIDVIENARRIGAQCHPGKRALQHGGQAARRPILFRKRRPAKTRCDCRQAETRRNNRLRRKAREIDALTRPDAEIRGSPRGNSACWMSRAMLISCSMRCRSRSRSTRRALSRMLAASPASASRICRSSFENAAGRRESMYSTPRKSPRLMLIIDSWVFARDIAYSGITTTARRRCATMLCAACRSMSACARSSVITGGFVAQRQLDRCLAGRQTLRRQTQTAAAPRQPHL